MNLVVYLVQHCLEDGGYDVIGIASTMEKGIEMAEKYAKRIGIPLSEEPWSVWRGKEGVKIKRDPYNYIRLGVSETVVDDPYFFREE